LFTITINMCNNLAEEYLLYYKMAVTIYSVDLNQLLIDDST